VVDRGSVAGNYPFPHPPSFSPVSQVMLHHHPHPVLPQPVDGIERMLIGRRKPIHPVEEQGGSDYFPGCAISSAIVRTSPSVFGNFSLPLAMPVTGRRLH